jgi:hypothetical protein
MDVEKRLEETDIITDHCFTNTIPSYLQIFIRSYKGFIFLGFCSRHECPLPDHLLIAILRLSWSIPQSRSTSDKIRIIRNPAHVVNDHARALRKYNIATTFPDDAILYDESIVPNHLRNRANIDDVDAY